MSVWIAAGIAAAFVLGFKLGDRLRRADTEAMADQVRRIVEDREKILIENRRLREKREKGVERLFRRPGPTETESILAEWLAMYDPSVDTKPEERA